MTNDTDRELLELAAKAAGIEGEYRTENLFDGVEWVDVSAIFLTDDMGYWNPLTDDGDEARLEAALQLGVVWFGGAVLIGRRGDKYPADWMCNEYYSDHGGDKQAARRRAGTRAAAEIGKSMP